MTRPLKHLVSALVVFAALAYSVAGGGSAGAQLPSRLWKHGALTSVSCPTTSLCWAVGFAVPTMSGGPPSTPGSS